MHKIKYSFFGTVGMQPIINASANFNPQMRSATYIACLLCIHKSALLLHICGSVIFNKVCLLLLLNVLFVSER